MGFFDSMFGKAGSSSNDGGTPSNPETETPENANGFSSLSDMARNATEKAKRTRSNIEARMPFPDAELQALARVNGTICYVGFYKKGILVRESHIQQMNPTPEGYAMATSLLLSKMMGNKDTNLDRMIPYYKLKIPHSRGGIRAPRTVFLAEENTYEFYKTPIVGAGSHEVFEFLSKQIIKG